MARFHDIEVLVENADAAAIPCDVLALKYAQHLYGLDQHIVRLISQTNRRILDVLPEVGDTVVFRSPLATGANLFLFVGTQPIHEFTYADTREFATSALRGLKTWSIAPRTLAMTIHGPGFGLDERDCFEAQLSGVVRAIEAGEHPPTLERVIFVELDPKRSRRLNEYLDQVSVDVRASEQAPSGTDPRQLSDKIIHTRETVFTAMPFSLEFEDVFNFGIQAPLHDAGYKCERMDQVSFVGDVVSEMRQRIEKATLVVADLTGANPNVYLEVGFAWACHRPVVLLARKTPNLGESLRFDAQGQRCLLYETITDLSQKLRHEVAQLKLEGQLDSPAPLGGGAKR